MSPREHVRGLLADALAAVVRDGGLAAVPDSIGIERPRRPEHGDFASGVAMVAAKGSGRPPRELADAVVRALLQRAPADVARAEVAGPGFINVKLTDDYWRACLARVLQAGENWGRSPARVHPRVLLEYVSANPTGPLHFAHGRLAALGDVLARVMRFAGYDVCREFYLNDTGNQVATLAVSVWVRYMEIARDAGGAAVPEIAFPENGYKGVYIRDIAQRVWQRDGDRWVGAEPPADIAPIRQFAIEHCLDLIKASLQRFDVTFDVWQSEAALHASGDVDQTLAALDKAGYIERRDNAVWLRTTALWGDDKDRVVVKSDGLPTYLLADIAYHRRKIERGFDELLNVWGADHHGHIPRMQAALKAFGHDPRRLGVILIQMVSLVRDGKPVAMGKREGEFITLDDVIDEVGRDATRFFYLLRRHDSAFEFDLDLARKQSMDNPVYYAQYAHARCASLRRRAAELNAPTVTASIENLRALALPEEMAILRRLADFPDFVADAAAAHEPHRLTLYVQELSQAFQSYYTQLQKVHGDSILPQERQRIGAWRDTWDWGKTGARLLWVDAVRQVLRNALGLLGVSTPDEMHRNDESDAA